MSPNHDEHEQRRERIAQALARPGPGRTEPDPDLAMALWGQIQDHLVPILGSRGVDALLARALTMTGASFPRLAEARKGNPAPDAFAILRTCLAAKPPIEASEANLALALTFTELLASFIGNSLTDRLLDPVWASGASATQQEDSP